MSNRINPMNIEVTKIVNSHVYHKVLTLTASREYRWTATTPIAREVLKQLEVGKTYTVDTGTGSSGQQHWYNPTPYVYKPVATKSKVTKTIAEELVDWGSPVDPVSVFDNDTFLAPILKQVTKDIKNKKESANV